MPSSKHTSHTWPENVGIIAIDVYFPLQYVCQTELEQFDGVSQGKYTVGLGQSKMGFCTDREDINSLCLTVLTNLMEQTQVGYGNVGRLEVGTETIIDKSKSVKSVLMQLFEESGNTDVEGVDTTNACYGGTAALLNAINWVESSAWDGRYAVVVAGDIAVYSQGPARPTGGAGAVAMLVGPNAPLVIERGLRASYMRHAYDFYKPDLSSEYPTVDGRLSIEFYLTALDSCYQTYLQRAAERSLGADFPTNIHGFDAFAFHSPYCRLVQKSFARLLLNDFFRCPETALANRYPGLEKFREKNLKMTYFDKDVEKAFLTFSKDLFEKKTKPSLLLPSEIGNMYTPSLYSGLVSIIANLSLEELAGKRIGLFSYGSGLASTMFSIRVSQEYGPHSSLWKLSQVAHDIKSRLTDRHKVDPEVFANIMAARERTHHKAPYSPSGDTAELFPGTWYLTHVDELHRRKYSRVALIPEKPQNSTLASCGEESTNGGASFRVISTNGHTNGGDMCEVTTT